MFGCPSRVSDPLLKQPRWLFIMNFNYFRYVLLVLCFICLASIFANENVVTFTFICMASDMSDAEVSANGTLIGRYDYSQSAKSAILMAVAVGTAVGCPLMSWLYIKYGARWPFFLCGMTSAVATALLPSIAYLGFYPLLALRFIQGLAYAADFVAIGQLCVRWAPLNEYGLFLAVLTTFNSIATAISNPITAQLCVSSLTWRSSYYFHAGFGILVFFVWLWLYRDDPQRHVFVNDKEVSKIHLNKTAAHIEYDTFVPYLEIIKNPIVVVVWINAFVEITAILLLLQYAPQYFFYVLGYDKVTTGYLSSLTSISLVPIKVAMGIVSDKLNCMNETWKIRIYNTFSVGVAGVFYALIGVIPPSQRTLAIVCFCLVNCMVSMTPGGFYKCASLISRQYAHFVLATVQFMKCAALFVAPGLVQLFVHTNESFDEWKWVYITCGIGLLMANFIFIFFATDKPAEFTQITRETTRKTKSRVEASKMGDTRV